MARADGPTPEVSIIVVSYQTRDMTVACLDSLYRETTATDFELIVVDNASDDGSVEAIRAAAPGARLIPLDRNIGFAAANNLAAETARGRYILLLNPDTVVRDRAIDRLVEFARLTPAARIWGGRTTFADGTLNPASCWARMTPWNQFCRAAGLTGAFPASLLFNGESYGGWQRDDIRGVDIVSGCFLLIETALWRQLGGFDLSLFMYGEDADLCLRAARLGARPLITPEAEIVHYGGASEKVRAAKVIKLLTAKSSLITKHWSPSTQWLGRLLLQAWPLSRWLPLAARARLTASPDARETASVWREVFAARRQWRRGYPPGPTPRPGAAPQAGRDRAANAA